jgi:uncharacterized protein YacL
MPESGTDAGVDADSRGMTVKQQRDSTLSPGVVEILRLCVVVFAAGLGFTLARTTAAADSDVRVGPFDLTSVGLILGAGVGYVLGGVVARLTGRSLREAEAAVRARSPEQVLAGSVGAVLGVLVGAGLAWPVLLVGVAGLTLPLFVFVCVTVGTLGYRLGLWQRDGLLAIFGHRAGVGPGAMSTQPKLLDTSVAVDGRIVDVVRAGFLHGRLVVPQPVLDELQGLADAGDDTRRAKGRRGLTTLQALRNERGLDVEVVDDEAPQVPQVDAKLVRMALDREIPLLTLDSNLARAADLAGCRVMNLHALSLALRPPVSAGDVVAVLLTRPGKEAGQAVGYLDDGTMVVGERARDHVGDEVRAAVTSVLTTANGRMVFARPAS